jgi:hypothetical protein
LDGSIVISTSGVPVNRFVIFATISIPKKYWTPLINNKMANTEIKMTLIIVEPESESELELELELEDPESRPSIDENDFKEGEDEEDESDENIELDELPLLPFESPKEKKIDT